MTLELAHQLALNKLVELLQTLTDPAEIRRVATAILRVKPAKQPTSNVPPNVDRRATAGAEPPQAPTPTPSPNPSCLRASVPSSLSPKPLFPDNIPDEQVELFRSVFIKRQPDRAAEFTAMTTDQFRTHLRTITANARAYLAQHPPPPDDDD